MNLIQRAVFSLEDDRPRIFLILMLITGPPVGFLHHQKEAFENFYDELKLFWERWRAYANRTF